MAPEKTLHMESTCGAMSMEWIQDDFKKNEADNKRLDEDLKSLGRTMELRKRYLKPERTDDPIDARVPEHNSPSSQLLLEQQQSMPEHDSVKTLQALVDKLEKDIREKDKTIGELKAKYNEKVQQGHQLYRLAEAAGYVRPG